MAEIFVLYPEAWGQKLLQLRIAQTFSDQSNAAQMADDWMRSREIEQPS